jgi:hypothetical protein
VKQPKASDVLMWRTEWLLAGEQNVHAKSQGTLARPLCVRSEEKLLLFLLCGLLRGLLCSFLGCHVVYSPFSNLMEHCDVTSSQFVLCILLSKKIVKKKTRIELSISVTRRANCSSIELRSSSIQAPAAAPRFDRVHGTRMNTGDSRLELLPRKSCGRREAFVAERMPRFREISAMKIFSVENTFRSHDGRIFAAVRGSVRLVFPNT